MSDTMLNPLAAFPLLIFTNIHEVEIILIAHIFKKKHTKKNKTKQNNPLFLKTCNSPRSQK